MDRWFDHDKAATVMVVLLFLMFAAFYIHHTSVVVGGERYYTLFDDEMISMRYARNMVEGHGLVMNPGERVEGFTNPLWVFYMMLVHLLPISATKISLVIQVTGALILAGVFVLVRLLAREIAPNRPAVASAAVVLTAAYFPLVNWSLLGCEVSLAALIAVGVSLLGIRSMRKDHLIPWLYFLTGASTLVRMDMAVIHLAILSGLALADKPRRNQHLAWGLGFLALFLGAQTIARVLYYGDILPNTYYLKMTGYPVLLRITRGLFVFWTFIWDFNIVLFILPAVVFFAAPDRVRGICACVFGAQCLYSIYVGGDAWEFYGGANRYIAPVMPLFFVLIADSFEHIKELAVGILAGVRNRESPLTAPLKRHLVALLVVFTLVHINLTWRLSNLVWYPHLVGPHMQNETSYILHMTETVEDLTTPNARVAVTWAGMLPYFSGRYIVDVLGKTDNHIARLPMRTATGVQRFSNFYPGHLKYDYSYSFGEQKPDIIVQLWRNTEEAESYLKNYIKVVVPGGTVFLRAGSGAVRWEKISGPRTPESQ